MSIRQTFTWSCSFCDETYTETGYLHPCGPRALTPGTPEGWLHLNYFYICTKHKRVALIVDGEEKIVRNKEQSHEPR